MRPVVKEIFEMILRWLFPDLFAQLDELEERVVALMADVFYRQRGIRVPAMVN